MSHFRQMFIIDLLIMFCALGILGLLRVVGVGGSPLGAHFFPLVVAIFELIRWTLAIVIIILDKNLNRNSFGKKAPLINPNFEDVLGEKEQQFTIPKLLKSWVTLMLVMGVGASFAQWYDLSVMRIVYNFFLGVFYFAVADISQVSFYLIAFWKTTR